MAETVISGAAIDQGPGRADLDAGTAADAAALAQGQSGVGDQQATGAAVLDPQGGVANQLAAGPHAAAAQDTAVVVQADVRMRAVQLKRLPVGLQGPVGHVLGVGRILQFAVAAAGLAVHAEMVALAEQQGQDEFTRRPNPGCAGLDDHFVEDRQGARGLQGAHAIHFNHAQPAAAVGLDSRVIAQGRDGDPGLAAGLQDGGPGVEFVLFSVNGYFDHA